MVLSSHCIAFKYETKQQNNYILYFITFLSCETAGTILNANCKYKLIKAEDWAHPDRSAERDKLLRPAGFKD